MTRVQRRRRTLTCAAFALSTPWLAPHIARGDGIWFLALAAAVVYTACQALAP